MAAWLKLWFASLLNAPSYNLTSILYHTSLLVITSIPTSPTHCEINGLQHLNYTPPPPPQKKRHTIMILSPTACSMTQKMTCITLAQATFPGTEWSSGYYSKPIPAVHEDQPQTFLPDTGKNFPLYVQQNWLPSQLSQCCSLCSHLTKIHGSIMQQGTLMRKSYVFESGGGRQA